MGKIIFFAIAIIIVSQILLRPGVKKLPWFFAGIMFFPLTVNIWQSPPISIPRLAIYSLLGTFLVKYRPKEVKEYPFKISTIILLAMLVCISVFDRNGSVFKIFKMFDVFIKNFCVLFFTYYYVRSVKGAKYIFKSLLFFLFFFCIYGILNYLIKQNVYIDFINKTFNANDVLSFYTLSNQRFRISSFAWHPIYYGFVLSIALFINLYLYGWKKEKKQKTTFNLIMFFLLFVNLLLTNSRTPLLAFLCGFSIFFFFGMNWNFKSRIIILGGILISLTLFFVPNSLKIVTDSLSTFSSEGSELKGSSVEMRMVQLSASINEFKKSPITGNGFGYIHEGLGYSANPAKSKSSDDFAEFESYFYKLLIEQGICGIAGNAALFISLYIFFYKHSGNRGTAKLSVLNAAMLTTFLVFIFGTGDMGSFIFFMSVMGVSIKYTIFLKKEQRDLTTDSLSVPLSSTPNSYSET